LGFCILQVMKNMLSKLVVLLITLASCNGIAQVSQTQAEQEIIGTWLLENDSNTKLVFQNNGTVKTYYSNVLHSTNRYEINNVCDGETLNNQLFLKTLNNQNEVIDCSYLDSINYNNNGKMTLVSQNQGKVILFIKQP